MDDFAGRMTAVGWLSLRHADRISQVVTNAATDRASLDLEVMLLYGDLHEKVRGEERFQKEWPALLQELDEIRQEAELAGGQDVATEEQHLTGLDVAAARLDVRLRQYELLVSCAVTSGTWDVSELPHDNRRAPRNGMVRTA